MDKETCLREATKVAVTNALTIAVVNDPVANAEEQGPYSYCPVASKDTLFPNGTVEATISPDGTITHY
jgi:hypothetical protein